MNLGLRVYVVDDFHDEIRPHLALRHGQRSDGNSVDVIFWDPLSSQGIQYALPFRKTLVVIRPTLVFVDPLRAAMLQRVA